MLRRKNRGVALGLALAVMLLPVAAQAAPRAGGGSGSVGLERMWGWVVSLWEKIGIDIDPAGLRSTAPSRAGHDFDPAGARVATPSYEGHDFDPLGQKAGTAGQGGQSQQAPPDTTDAGHDIDPAG